MPGRNERRRRYRKQQNEEKPVEQQRPVTLLAKRVPTEEEHPRATAVRATSEADIKPKILLKTKAEREGKENDDQATGASTESNVSHQQTESASNSEAILVMSRPSTILSSTGAINLNAKKLFLRDNTDFLVVGVIGSQGVGKSTIMNLLLNDQPDTDYNHRIFLEENGIFPIKLRQTKSFSRSRTESVHMFITQDRTILLDSPPILCNSYKKDMFTNEIDDLRYLIIFLSVCHLVICVQDDYAMNMNFLRLLQLAELMKPPAEKNFNSSYSPNLLFLKNRAKPHDFQNTARKQTDEMLSTFFRDSQLQIFLGQSNDDPVKLDKQHSSSTTKIKRTVNTFLLPEVKEDLASPTSYHKSVNEIVEDLRYLVLTTPRNPIANNPAEFNELAWFELFLKSSAQNLKHFFFDTYEDVCRKQLDISNNPSGTNAKDSLDNWRD